MANFNEDVNVNGQVLVTRPWSDWLFLRQQRDVGGNGGFHIHNPWGNSAQPQGAADRNRLEIGYRTAGGQDLWGQLVIHGPSGNVGIGTSAPQDKLHVAGNVRANDVIVTSDVRLKAAIRPIASAKRKLERLRGVEFEWRDPSGSARGRSAGFVAQEVEAVAPELVHADSAKGYEGVNLGGMLGTLVEAFKELAAENGALRSRIEALEQAAATYPVARPSG
jgi:Chaperone of endosialidase